MKITKIGHCCLLIGVEGKRILTDPGSFTSTSQNASWVYPEYECDIKEASSEGDSPARTNARFHPRNAPCLQAGDSGVDVFTIDELITDNIDIVLITHEHADHVHIESLQRVIDVNPEVVIFTNSGVGKLLTDAGISYQILEGNADTQCFGIHIEAHDAKHEEMYKEMGQVQNTGYFIADTLFYPGDSYALPQKEVKVLAFPIGGPWCRIKDAIEYVLTIKPQKAFPVHDGIERIDRVGILHRIPSSLFPEHDIDFIPLKAGDTAEF